MSSTVTTQLPTGTWSIDPIHSSIGFGVKHLGVSTFRGNFKQAAGTLESKDGEFSAITGKVLVENLVTEEPQLTGHLHSADFFDGENYPEITFKSTSIVPADDDKFHITGDLTIRGTTKPVELEAELEGVGDGPDGNPRLGIVANGALDRGDWGITWNQALANGALAVAERVTIQLHVEAVKQA